MYKGVDRVWEWERESALARARQPTTPGPGIRKQPYSLLNGKTREAGDNQCNVYIIYGEEAAGLRLVNAVCQMILE